MPGAIVALYFRNLSFFVQCRTELEALKGRGLQGRLVQKLPTNPCGLPLRERFRARLSVQVERT